MHAKPQIFRTLFSTAAAIIIVTSINPSEAAVIVNGGGTSGEGITVTLTQDIVIGSKPGESFGGYFFGFSIDGVIDGAATTAAQFVGNWYDLSNTSVDDATYQTSATSPSSSLSTSNISLNFNEDRLMVFFGTPDFTEYLVSDNAFITFKAGTITLEPTLGNIVLLSPGSSFEITEENLFSSSEQYQNITTQNVAMIPETSSALLGLCGLAVMLRRRRTV